MVKKVSESGFTYKDFYEFCSEGKLMGGRCKKCGEINIPPLRLCRNCYSNDLEWVQLKGEGEIITYTIVNVPSIFLKDYAPYGFAVVRLDCGANFIGMMEIQDPEETGIGQRVKVEFGKAEALNETVGPPTGKRPRIILRPIDSSEKTK